MRKPRPSDLRCALCHDALEAPLYTCTCRCGAQLHIACRQLIGRCPTLGCPQSVRAAEPAPAPVRPRAAERSLARDILSIAITVSILDVIGVAAFCAFVLLMIQLVRLTHSTL